MISSLKRCKRIPICLYLSSSNFRQKNELLLGNIDSNIIELVGPVYLAISSRLQIGGLQGGQAEIKCLCKRSSDLIVSLEEELLMTKEEIPSISFNQENHPTFRKHQVIS
jgi:hypothetical protein